MLTKSLYIYGFTNQRMVRRMTRIIPAIIAILSAAGLAQAPQTQGVAPVSDSPAPPPEMPSAKPQEISTLDHELQRLLVSMDDWHQWDPSPKDQVLPKRWNEIFSLQRPDLSQSEAPSLFNSVSPSSSQQSQDKSPAHQSVTSPSVGESSLDVPGAFPPIPPTSSSESGSIGSDPGSLGTGDGVPTVGVPPNVGTGSAPAVPAAVPEPGSLFWIGLIICALARRSRRVIVA